MRCCRCDQRRPGAGRKRKCEEVGSLLPCKRQLGVVIMLALLVEVCKVYGRTVTRGKVGCGGGRVRMKGRQRGFDHGGRERRHRTGQGESGRN